MFRTIRWRIAIPYVILILLATAALTLYFSDFMRQTHLADLRTQLMAEVRLVGDAIQPLLAEGDTIETLDPLAKRWGELLEARVTIIRADGVVLGDSHEDPAAMENHLGRPEVQQALADGFGISIRYSHTVGYDMMYVAIPVDVGGAESGETVFGTVLFLCTGNSARSQMAEGLVITFWVTNGRCTQPARRRLAT